MPTAGWLLGAALIYGVLSFWGRAARWSRLSAARPDRLRRAGLLIAAGVLIVAALSLPGPGWAQESRRPAVGDRVEPNIPGMPLTIAGITGYDAGGRRDPFVPLFGPASGETSASRFELLKLTGIFRGSGANSLVVLEDPAHRGYFVRLGQTIGSARLVEILPQGAVFEVHDYGASRRVVLRLERSEENP